MRVTLDGAGKGGMLASHILIHPLTKMKYTSAQDNRSVTTDSDRSHESEIGLRNCR